MVDDLSAVGGRRTSLLGSRVLTSVSPFDFVRRLWFVAETGTPLKIFEPRAIQAWVSESAQDCDKRRAFPRRHQDRLLSSLDVDWPQGRRR
jgi:hypothetical protein